MTTSKQNKGPRALASSGRSVVSTWPKTQPKTLVFRLLGDRFFCLGTWVLGLPVAWVGGRHAGSAPLAPVRGARGPQRKKRLTGCFEAGRKTG